MVKRVKELPGYWNKNATGLTEGWVFIMSSMWEPSSEYEKIVKANIMAYAKKAEWHDTIQTRAYYDRWGAMLDRDLDEIVGMLSSSKGRDIHALDACGGSGSVALRLLKRGVKVTLCDVTPEMIEIFESKCMERGFAAEAVCAEIGSFLSSTDGKFDLVVFSAALHHLYDYTAILRLASSRLNPGGMLYTTMDGTRHDFLERSIIMAGYLLFAFSNYPRDLPSGFLRKFRRMNARHLRDSAGKERLQLTEPNIGILADYYALSGIDDFALVNEMRRHGFEVIWHKRYPDARYGLFRFLLRLLKRQTGFKLLLRWKTEDLCCQDDRG